MQTAFTYLAGRTALVTGSAQGIGWSIAKSLASRGCNIALNDLAPANSNLDKIKVLSDTFNIRADYFQADMRSPEQIYQAIDKAKTSLGEIDILVNNAGIVHSAPIEKFPVEKWDDHLAIHVSAWFHTIQKCLPHMKEQKWGRIIQICSGFAKVGGVGKAGYCAAKAAQMGLTKTVALESAKHGVTCNAILPGFVKTGMVEESLQEISTKYGIPLEDVVKETLKLVPQKEFVEPSAIGDMVAYLCSESARNITGAEMPIDAGITVP